MVEEAVASCSAIIYGHELSATAIPLRIEERISGRRRDSHPQRRAGQQYGRRIHCVDSPRSWQLPQHRALTVPAHSRSYRFC